MKAGRRNWSAEKQMTVSNVAYTVVRKDGNYTYAKQGCCGGTIKIPLLLGLVADIGEDIDVHTELIRGVSVHRVLIDGSWVEV